jgi:bifunctional non-homologous end joining protein LigD
MARKQLGNLPGARKTALPGFVAPQLATLVKEPPSGTQWLHELKFDGYRMLCRIDRGKVQFWSRNGKDWTAKFLNLVEEVRSLPVETAIIDGEIVVEDAKGRASFQSLQRALANSVKAKFLFHVFDLIYLDGFNLTGTPLRERKLVLEEVCKSAGSRGRIQYSDHVEGNGEAFFKRACEYGIEGIVSKLATSIYESARNRNWLKVKCNKQQEFVIAGHTPSSKGLPGFGSLVLGVYQNGTLIYAGRVGTGFSLTQRVELRKRLDKVARKTSPFAHTPIDPGLKQTQWVEPKLIAAVTFTEWTSDGSIRHPSFQGLREDKSPKEVVRE